jgi:hypothetical protein
MKHSSRLEQSSQVGPRNVYEGIHNISIKIVMIGEQIEVALNNIVSSTSVVTSCAELRTETTTNGQLEAGPKVATKRGSFLLFLPTPLSPWSPYRGLGPQLQ